MDSQYSQLEYMFLFLKKTTHAISFTADTGWYLLVLWISWFGYSQKEYFRFL